jgi:phage terminase Nu1 subunit (DNA packaging protein)
VAISRSELAQEQTIAARLKNMIARGDYVSLELFGSQVDAMMGVFRERILSIPGKIADALLGRTREEIDLILREELNEALEELSNPAYVGSGTDRRATGAIAQYRRPSA